jgi:RimJ/RimL family protein N-acetyltransferase
VKKEVRGEAVLRRLRAAVAERLRRRLLPPEERVLPAFPTEGLAGTGVVVRPYTEQDAADRLALEHSPGMELWRTAFASPMQSVEEARNWCRSQRASLLAGTLPVGFAISARDGTYLGDLELIPVRDQRGAVEIALGMMPDARGRSLGLNASNLLLRWMADHAGFQRFETTHVVANRAACLICARVGIPKEGVKRAAFPVRDAVGDVVWHDMCMHGAPVDEFPIL